MAMVLLQVVVAAAAASTSATATSNAALIYCRHRKPFRIGISSSSWRRDRIRPYPGWHPCAKFHVDYDDDNIRNTDDSGSIPAVMMDDCADKVIDFTSSSSSSSPKFSSSTVSIHDNNSDEDKNHDTNNNIELSHNSQSQKQQQQQQLASILILLTVPAAWGTYAPAVKYIYDVTDSSSQPSMPGLVFSAGYYCVAALTLGILSFYNDRQIGHAVVMKGDGSQKNMKTVREASVEKKKEDTSETHLGDIVYKKDEREVSSRGGWELGSYLFIGNALQVAGLQTVPADRAAFLVQLTTVMVPLLSAFSAGKLSAVSIKTWAACAIAFAGVVVMGADGNDNDSGSMLLDLADNGSNDGTNYADYQLSHLLHLMSGGDLLIVLAAFAYSMHVLRLGAYAPRTAPLRLAAAKAKAETVFSVSVVLVLAYIGGGGGAHASFLPEFIVKTGDDVSKYFSWLVSDRNAIDPLVPSIGAILWTGWVTCAYTIYAQSFGQRHVNPTDANLIYATQPLFTSLFAYFLLGETLGPNGFVGAALIGTALWLVSK